MSDPLILVLQICLMALVYLFFLRVLRAVWVEVSPPAALVAGPRSSRKVPSRQTPRLVVLAPPEARGQQYDLRDELTIGRAAGCHITVDDTYVSQLHTRVFTGDGQVMVEDLGSTNGTYVNRQKVTAPAALRAGDQLQVGNTVMELT